MNEDHHLNEQPNEGPVSDNYIYQCQKHSADRAGLNQELQQFQTKNSSDLSRGGSSGYPLWLRA